MRNPLHAFALTLTLGAGAALAAPAVMEADAGLPTHTVYRPARLPADPLPIVAFANGGCENAGNRFRPFLTEIASHGYLVVAIGPIVPAGDKAVRVAPAPGSPAAAHPELAGSTSLAPGSTRPSPTYAAQLIQAIDWAIAENARPGSPYHGKLDRSRIAVMGQSCGGLQAIDAAHDPRVRTLAVLNSGVFPANGRSWEIAAAHADIADLATLHGSVLYLTGDPRDAAFPQSEDNYARTNHIPAVRLWRENTPHMGTYREENGGAFGTVVVAWLDWQLKGDRNAAHQFLGAGCGLCTRPEWHVQSKGF
ncbi:alpha/beta hydrolase [Massilia sp. GER05]|uniref:alpha/beta hydrolase n=1 Tax=Massilia sp. GER05 TaxID=3394605 RepID=UPI003F86D663